MPPPTPSSHRPRKKRKPEPSSSNGTVILNSEKQQEQPAFSLAAFFWPAKGTNVSQWTILPIILMVSFLFRWCTALWPYSGYQKPPMHGDFEAQRHWMELTINLPVTHWYFHDLEWWGLDYPPLTAYHSALLGGIGWLIDPTWFQLYLSRGLDEAGLKVFMRSTVIISEFLIYVPAAVLCVRQLARLCNVNAWESSIALTAILMQPATILIDHGHFQYNTVMLGFTLATIAAMIAGRPLWSCVFFVAALGFKQMALFYAPAVAAYLAGICISPGLNIGRFVGIATITLASFAVLFLPLLLGTVYDTYRSVPPPSDAVIPQLLTGLPWSISERSWYYPYAVQIAQSIHRIFPFSRGLFEDKVANVWCAVHSSGLHKLNKYSPDLLSKAALGLTLLSILPPCTVGFLKPKKEIIPTAFAATAWGFFLSSYQVHEKNILLPLLPMTLLLAMDGGMKPATRAWVGYANILACFTMFPLLTRDGLRIPYFVLTSLYIYLLGLPPLDISAYVNFDYDPTNPEGIAEWTKDAPGALSRLVHLATYMGILSWHIVEAIAPPPADKPDLWVVASVCLGCAGFGCCYLWCLWKTVEGSEILYDLGLWKREADVQKKAQ